MTYLDTSVLAAYYCPESISEEVETQITQLNTPVISWLIEVELASAVSRKVRENQLKRNEANRVILKFQSHIEQCLFRRVPVLAIHFEIARTWISKFSTPLRTLDALHLAVVSQTEMVFCTADVRLADAANFFGIEVQLIRNSKLGR